MTTSAPSPPPAGEPVSPVDRRGRRVYILWAIALALLLAAAAFCWAVVVPVWRTHRVRKLTASIVEERAGNKIFEQQALDRLGTRDETISRLGEYVRETSSRHRHVAAELLGACGKRAEPDLVALLGDTDANVRLEFRHFKPVCSKRAGGDVGQFGVPGSETGALECRPGRSRA